jgi:hypothetical protein
VKQDTIKIGYHSFHRIIFALCDVELFEECVLNDLVVIFQKKHLILTRRFQCLARTKKKKESENPKGNGRRRISQEEIAGKGSVERNVIYLVLKKPQRAKNEREKNSKEEKLQRKKKKEKKKQKKRKQTF